ncbi:Signal recognition particle receptor FtsY [Synechococcus sp. WH 8101]|uniref:signal recognition particle-docking protein FtsY n=1 Tax=Synechococcus sp. WH 8101 TaxID=59932 RepID=UPI001023F0CF|nr:signal recognition particle-docking protein FtsY [Synechococcus sp. WH 8101]QBE67627.1 Signal recognition particle receptor FtsY [Synechococcus sp. WH 8101]QNI43823.1 signal recognition particle-docking protein FtsY [Synechococcus sp. WH 8101]
MVYDWFNRSSVPNGEDATSPPTPEVGEAAAEATDQTASEATEEDPLEWARQAYARLKAQKAQAQAAQDTPKQERAAEPDSSPDPDPPVAPPSPPPAPSAPLSLLEQAAAQRQERLQDLESRASRVEEPAPVPPVRTAQTSETVQDSQEPQLGDFDDTFTWSAEVLAAQGRQVDQVSLEEIDWLGRLRRGLEKTRQGFVTSLLETLGDDPLTPEVVDDLEALLLRADAGVQATDQVMEALRRRLNEEVVDPGEGIRFLKEQLRGLLEQPIQASGVELLAPERGRLNIWLMVGVNGVGKTTTLGKLANLAVRSGYSALVAAADTFRAAAVQQVAVWAERSDVPVISNPSANADPAAVVFDAIGAARSKGVDLLLVDTAGRLQTKHNLMEELQKIRRIVDRLAPEARVESLLVLDASQGQNGLKQAMAFAKAADLTGVVITKLDGTARGGVALAVASEAGLPIRFIGAGEGIRDLRPFNSFEFVEALLAGR